MNQSVKTEERKQWCLYQNRYKDERRKSVTPSVVRHKNVKNHHYKESSLSPETKKYSTSTVFISKWQTLTSPTQIYQHPELTTISYDYITNLQPTNRIMCLNTYLCTYARMPILIRCLSLCPSSRPSRKLVE